MTHSYQQAADHILVEQILAGQATAQSYRALVDRHKNYAYTIALQILHNPEEAEEVAQDAFVGAFKALHTFRKEAKFTTWFYRIVLNAALTRKEKVKRFAASIEEAETLASDLSADTSKTREQKYFIEQAMKKLSPDDVLMIRLFYLKELSLEEMAEKVSIEANTVKIKLHRARKRLAFILHDMLKGEEQYLIA